MDVHDDASVACLLKKKNDEVFSCSTPLYFRTSTKRGRTIVSRDTMTCPPLFFLYFFLHFYSYCSKRKLRDNINLQPKYPRPGCTNELEQTTQNPGRIVLAMNNVLGLLQEGRTKTLSLEKIVDQHPSHQQESCLVTSVECMFVPSALFFCISLQYVLCACA